VQLETEIAAIIRWASASSPRSLQALPGPSELGDPCDRRLAYRLAGTEPTNTRVDPLASVVGTGLHSWLEDAIRRFNATFGDDTLLPETRVQIDPMVAGTSDLYHRQLRSVVDYKSGSREVIDDAIAHGPQPGYRVQAHLYGLGYEQLGLEVDRVAIIYIPRAGTLKGIHAWSAAYDRSIAEGALKRMYAIGDKVAELKGNPRQFALIDAKPSSKSCWFCPYKGDDFFPEATTTAGCPGR
jgi:hypothetical protein